ncbi:DUF2059 domain-containing protein [Parerythrobacter lacustris]|uniref:DUF2059 domain-containing protein n=1 Tax=Parerythrobacter lacustris TaxID=2969984 RepID=A0ABT1XRN9_9SPHN|nr:DUF2059 domain-containing protein [Parerythrobacter lacustris]MCR2834311.1 DUF2059 domain-containing protein [Parerythrobacter lacustris]
MRSIFSALAAATLLFSAGAPALAQDADPMEGDPFAAMAGMFTAEPLTPEQEARLPLATTIIAKLIPEGALGEMFGTMFDSMMGPLAELGSKPSSGDVAEYLGFEGCELYLEEDQAAEALAILDPAWEARKAAEAEVFPEVMKQMMDAMEPGMRKAMAELYAVNFTERELTDIEAFFSTETGATYARKSFSMASDPRIMAASMESLPAMMGSIMTMEQKVEEATANLPPKRDFAELGAKEKARLAELTGYSVEEIEDAIRYRDEAADAMAEGAEAAADVAAEY